MGVLCLALTQCGQPASGPHQVQQLPDIPHAQAATPHFPCATGTAPLRPDCTAERTRTAQGWIVTLRHPDGHFRRLKVGDDGTVAAADGAEPARATTAGGEIEVAVAGDRYRLPAAR